MKQVYKEFETLITDLSEVNDLSFTLVSAMKGCIADCDEAYKLLALLEMLHAKTETLYEKSEDFSMKLLQTTIEN